MSQASPTADKLLLTSLSVTSADRVWSAAACLRYFKTALASCRVASVLRNTYPRTVQPPARNPQPCLLLAQLGLACSFVRARAQPQQQHAKRPAPLRPGRFCDQE